MLAAYVPNAGTPRVHGYAGAASRVEDTVVQIVPYMPPTISGVGDYAMRVGTAIVDQRPAVRVCYVATGAEVAQGSNREIDWVDLTGRCSAPALTEALLGTRPGGLRDAVVVLHYVGYGYDRRGCPGWLVDAITALRHRAPGARLVTFFHELYASGRPWQSSFWLTPRQRRIARAIAACSDDVLTSRVAYAAWLDRCVGPRGPKPTVLAIPSTIGEPAVVGPLGSRGPYAVHFGGRALKEAVYRKFGASVQRFCEVHGIERIVDVGSPPRDLGVVRPTLVDVRGYQSASELSLLLSGARIGFATYYRAHLSKSSVFAAYASHGVPVALCASADSEADGLVADQHYVELPANPGDVRRRTTAELQRAADANCAWYRGHDIDAHGRALVRALGGAGDVEG